MSAWTERDHAAFEIVRRSLAQFCERLDGTAWSVVGDSLVSGGWAATVLRDCVPDLGDRDVKDAAIGLCRWCALELCGLMLEQEDPPSLFRLGAGLNANNGVCADLLRKAYGRAKVAGSPGRV